MAKGSLLYSLLSILLLSSCDCHVSVKGKVISTESKLPIEGAIVEMIGKNITTKTNKNGYFHIWDQTGFCYEPNIKITIDKYKPFEIKFIKSGDSKSYELQSKSESLDYDEPFYPDSKNKNTFITGTWIEKYSEKFSVLSDTVTFYLDTIDVASEIKKTKSKFRNSN